MESKEVRRSVWRKRLIWAAGVVLVLLVGVWVLSRVGPAPADLVPEPPVAVTLTRPFDGVTYSMIAPIEARGEAVSDETVVSLTLYDNGEPVATQAADPYGYNAFRASWSWLPQTEGVHILTLHAVTASGRKVASGPVWVKTTRESNALAMETYTAEGGESLPELAEAHGSSLRDLLRHNRLGDPAAPLEAGEQITVPVPLPDAEPSGDPPEGDPAPGAGKAPREKSSGLVDWVNQQVSAKTPQLPAAPGMTGSLEDCSPQLTITDYADNEAGFFIYRTQPGDPAPELVATLKQHPGTGSFAWTDPAPGQGSLSYFVSAYNAAGEAPHPGVIVQVKGECTSSRWTGVDIHDGYLQLPSEVSRVYLYVSLNGGKYLRIPPGEDQYLTLTQQGYDLNPYLDPLLEAQGVEAAEIKFEVWGWRSGHVDQLAEGQGELAPASVQPVLNPSAPELVMNSIPGSFGDLGGPVKEAEIFPQPWSFRWKPRMEGVSSARWQISLIPLPAAPVVNPPGLVAEGELQAAGSEAGFSIDFGELLLDQEGDGFSQLGGDPQDLFIRVLVFKGGQPVAVTNTVVGHYVPDTGEPFKFQAPLYQLKIAEFRPPDIPDPNRWGCLEVTGIKEEFEKSSITKAALGAWGEVGREICPESYTGDADYGWSAFWDDLSGFVVDAINWAADTYNSIKQIAVNLVVDFLPCDELGVEGACQAIVDAAVNYGMAALGLPPSIPDFDALVEMGKGEAVAFATDFAVSQLPGGEAACSTLCQEGIEKAFGEALDAGVEMLEKDPVSPGCVDEAEAHAHGVEPLCPPNFVITRPAPGAVYTPPIVVLEVTKTGEAPEDAPASAGSCPLQARLKVTNQFEGGRVYGPSVYEYMDIGPRTLEGYPYVPEFTGPPPGMEVGESQTIFITFEQVQEYILPWNQTMYADSQIAPNAARDWQTLLFGGKLTVTVSPAGSTSLPCANQVISEKLPARIYWEEE